MWIKRDFSDILELILPKELISSKENLIHVGVLKGPRQVGKTSILDILKGYQLIPFDDHMLRLRAQESPTLFLEQLTGPLILDEASLVPELFFEIKRKVDHAKRLKRRGESFPSINYWITGSNQTLLSKFVQESLAGRASFYNLNTLSIHEIGKLDIPNMLLRGGWPELYVDFEQSPVKYLNNLISTFIEKDIVQAAGIEKKAAFTKTLHLIAGQVGELINFSQIASAVSVESTTVQSWVQVLEENGLIKCMRPYLNKINKRLIKTPKIYFEDIGLAVRLQGWMDFQPILTSPYFGFLIENMAYAEISRFFINKGIEPQIYFLRSKEKVEVDFLIELPNQRFIAAEVKTTARDFSYDQIKLIQSLKVNVIEYWILSPQKAPSFGNHKVISFLEVYECLERLFSS